MFDIWLTLGNFFKTETKHATSFPGSLLFTSQGARRGETLGTWLQSANLQSEIRHNNKAIRFIYLSLLFIFQIWYMWDLIYSPCFCNKRYGRYPYRWFSHTRIIFIPFSNFLFVIILRAMQTGYKMSTRKYYPIAFPIEICSSKVRITCTLS